MNEFKRLSIIEHINKNSPSYNDRLINFNKILDDLKIKPSYGWDISMYDGLVTWKESHDDRNEL